MYSMAYEPKGYISRTWLQRKRGIKRESDKPFRKSKCYNMKFVVCPCCIHRDLASIVVVVY